MAKVAKLVTLSVTVRIVVDENTEDYGILKVAFPLCVNTVLQDGLFEHVEGIKDDEECPYGTFEGDE